MQEVEIRLMNELENIYRYSKANDGCPPRKESPIYQKYETIKTIIDALEKTNYVEASVLRHRYLKGKSYESLTMQLSYSRSSIYDFKKKAESLFVQKAIELELVK